MLYMIRGFPGLFLSYGIIVYSVQFCCYGPQWGMREWVALAWAWSYTGETRKGKQRAEMD